MINNIWIMQQLKHMNILTKVRTNQSTHKYRCPFNILKYMKASSMIRWINQINILCPCRGSITIRMAKSSPKYQMTCKECFKLTTIKICLKWFNNSWFLIRSKACISIIYCNRTPSHLKIMAMTNMKRTTSIWSKEMLCMVKVKINLFISQLQSILILKCMRRGIKIKMKWIVSIWCTNNNKWSIFNN